MIASAIEQVRPLIESRRHALRWRLPAGPLWVKGDRTRLTQILTNLLNNAAKYTPEGGEVDLDATTSDGWVTLNVCDNGQGIEPSLLPQIFELFTQAERSPDRTQGGLGIGLALVRSLVTLHGGTIKVDSLGRNQGARFTVCRSLLRRSANCFGVAVNTSSPPRSNSASAALPCTRCSDARFLPLASVKIKVPCAKSKPASASLFGSFAFGSFQRSRPAIIR